MPETSSFRGYDFEKPVLELEDKIAELEALSKNNGAGSADELAELQEKCLQTKKSVYSQLTPWQRVQLARHPRRPYSLDYIQRVFSDFIELHGDRCFADDKAIVGGPAFLDDIPVMVIGHQKGRSVQESMARNFGMPHPEGYRKALRLMKLAAQFDMPIITLIDTSGAYPGIGAEERGQATAIAESLRDMSALPVPILCCVIGEGGSGGALAIGIGDRLLMMENAWYSVISPEGCAAILFRDAAKAPEAAQALKLTASDLKELSIIDETIPEPLGGAHRDVDVAAQTMKDIFKTHLRELRDLSTDELMDRRYKKLRAIGIFQEQTQKQVKSAPPKKRKKSKQLMEEKR
ncbi:MAG TPA: acetyl-CoA carboxylase carboxyltransferase subunit alpha [Elusimicrobiota bacterium]|nr:acetyl-CoA carboxylase carboxyltransferase subunit alpha [Elusimicrobiota bacterium]